MLQHCCIVLFAILSGIACSSAKLNKAPFLTKSGIDQNVSTISEASEAPSDRPEASPSVPMTAEPKTPEEVVSPPANISGSYLICAESKTPTEASPESIISCGLRDQASNNKINLESNFANTIWSYQVANMGSLVVMISELKSSLEWHVAVSLKASSLAEVQMQRDSIRFFLNAQDNMGVKYQESAPVSPMFIQWMALDGAKVPTDAVLGGTQDDATDDLFICRIYAGGEVIPGKLLVHYNDANKSSCYTSLNNSSLQSQTNDSKTLVYKNDVLRITAGVFEDFFEWVPATNGAKPMQAVAMGTDGLGNPLYSCRNLQVDGAVAEQTPGVLRPDATGCTHQYYGVNTHSDYQVLTWKQSGTQKILSSGK